MRERERAQNTHYQIVLTQNSVIKNIMIHQQWHDLKKRKI